MCPLSLCLAWWPCWVLMGSSGSYLLGSFPPCPCEEAREELDLLGLMEGRLEFLLRLCLPDFPGCSLTFSSESLWLSIEPLSSDTTSLPCVSFMLRNLGGGVRPDLADSDLCSSTRPPMLDMERPEAECVLDLRPPPTC